ncbi:hypothetical protein [Litchfieldella xinjiangensis]|uniref:hypothetical protein n=1 Tax=Litchfieldella xinjiangensis TaxID=1166948 RepID=UPI0005BE4C71|nr:hypothetical protein [Halomonas xinjiangensis]
MIPIHRGNVVTLVQESARVADLVPAGQRLIWRRRTEDDKPMSVGETANARREAEYVARRNGLKAPLLQLWKVPS